MGKVILSVKEKQRLEAFRKVSRKELSLRKAATLLGLGYRQARRSYGRFLEQGAGGMAHRARGAASNRTSSPKRRQAVLNRYRERYADFGPTLAAEYLAKDKLPVSVQTLRRWLMEEGLWQAKARGSTHRAWRPRKECFGEMVQMDGSHHDWFEGRRDWAVLMVMVDDATNWTTARFFEGETTEAAMTMMRGYVGMHGLPRSVYVDRDSIYRVNRDASAEEALAGEGAMSQFGRAMKDLAVELICAHSPQAKGRVERQNGVLQDRLVKAMRLSGIATLEKANAFLEKRFLKEFNGRFEVRAANSANVHRRVPQEMDLTMALSIQEQRVVCNDWTIQWRNRWLQLTTSNRKLALAKQRVTVCEQLDGRVRVRFRGRDLEYVELPERPERREETPKVGSDAAGPREGRKPWKPASNHPWRKGL